MKVPLGGAYTSKGATTVTGVQDAAAHSTRKRMASAESTVIRWDGRQEANQF